MNKREKLLTVLLTAAIILLGGFKLLIEPAIHKMGEKKQELASVQLAKDTANQNVLRAAQIDQSNSKLESEITKNVLPFFPELKNDIIQPFFKQIADQNGIRFDSFIMLAPVVTQVKNLNAVKNEIKYPAKEAAEKIESINNASSDTASATASAASSTAGTSSSGSTATDVLEMMNVTMQFQTSYPQSIAFLDGIKSSGRIMRVVSFNISTSDNKQITNITVECYGIVKFTQNDNLSKNSLSAPVGKVNPFS